MSGLQSALTIDDLKVRARRRVPKQFFDYSESGSWTETTFRANESDFAGVTFRQRVAVDMRDRSLKSTMVGQEVSLPLAVAPAAICGLQTGDGEIHAARAAQAFGIPFTLSSQLNPILREYRRASSASIDASLKPLMQRHLGEIAVDLTDRGFAGELLVVSSFGGVLGVVVGLGFGALSARLLADDGFSFVVPIGSIITVLIVAAIVAALAATLPARRAGKIDIVQALGVE